MSIADDLAAYGARLGIVEPLLLRMVGEIDHLRIVQEALRARKDYEAADRLRKVIENMQGAADYAFPQRTPIDNSAKQ